MPKKDDIKDKKDSLDKAYKVFQKRLGVIRKIHERIKADTDKKK